MAEWDGQGLPPAARARIDRAAADGVRSSLLDIRGEMAVRTVGLEPVGEVMGGLVEHLGWAGYGGCGIYAAYGSSRVYDYGDVPTLVSGAGNGWAGFAPYVKALYHGYDTAIQRMLLEAQALGADGVVGVTCKREQVVGMGWEFVVRGTAVRATSGPRPKAIFYTDLGGADTAKSMHAGFMPHSMVWGISVGIRHDDYFTRSQTRSWSNQNVEIAGYTELVSMVRADARNQFDRRVASRGATAATVTDMNLRIWEAEPSDGHRDHLAESIVVGNALVRFDPKLRPRTDSLVVVPLRRIR